MSLLISCRTTCLPEHQRRRNVSDVLALHGRSRTTGILDQACFYQLPGICQEIFRKLIRSCSNFDLTLTGLRLQVRSDTLS